jgi:8-oxo-dGTP pyrophosphatase MutT (NUDIX family)
MTLPADFLRLGERLRDYGGASEDPDPSEGGFVASVALLLRPAERSPEILLIKRSEFAGDPWSGHMAFPGGRKEVADRSLLETARRETLEETGIALPRSGRLLGRLDSVAPLSPLLPPLAIVPFVFVVPSSTRALPDRIEVAEVHWVPLDHFQAPDSRTEHRFAMADESRIFPAFRVEGRVVWGLTHRILEDLLARLT